jgi:hypothetical protein
MRISLLDPKWKEQKEAMLNKIKDTTKVGARARARARVCSRARSRHAPTISLTVTPHHTASHHATPCHVTPRRAAPPG